METKILCCKQNKRFIFVGSHLVKYRFYPGLRVVYNSSNVIDDTSWYAHPLCLRDCMQSFRKGCVSVSYKDETCILLNLRKDNLSYVTDPDFFYYDITEESPGNIVIIVNVHIK